MKAAALLILLLTFGACGDDDEVPTPDASTARDAGLDVSTDVGADFGSGETPRPELDEVVVDREVTFFSGEADLVVFDVPDDAVSVMVSITGQAGRNYTLGGWRNGDGSELVPFDWFDTEPPSPALSAVARVCLTCPNRIVAINGAFAAIAPNNEAVSLQPGEHSIRPFGYRSAGFVVNRLNDESATVRVVIKRLPAEPTAGVLDLNVYLTGAQGWTAESAPTDTTLQQMLAEVEAIYSGVGIRLGVITYTDVPEEYAVIESVLFGTKLQELFALSDGHPRDALNIFLVDELFAGSGPDGMSVLLGIAGGIPGPIEAGTVQSGVAINTTGDPALDVPTSRVIAHEVGHYLGLFHSSEASGDLHDPIADTALNQRTLLMYASPDGAEISATQGAVLRHNVWVNHGASP